MEKKKQRDINIVILDGNRVNPGDNSWDEIARLGTLTVYDITDTSDVIARA